MSKDGGRDAGAGDKAGEQQHIAKNRAKEIIGGEISDKPGGVYHPDNLKVIRGAENSHAQGADKPLYPVTSNARAPEQSKQATFSAEGPYNNRPYYVSKADSFNYLGDDVKDFGRFATMQDSANPNHPFNSYTADATLTGGVLGAIALGGINPFLIPVGFAAGAAAGFEIDAAFSRMQVIGRQMRHQQRYDGLHPQQLHYRRLGPHPHRPND